MSDKFNTVDIKVDGEVITAPIVDNLTIHQIGDEMDVVSAKIGRWSNIAAAAEEDLAGHDAVYRNWRASETLSILDAEPKLAEWKVKAKLEADPMFLELKGNIAKAKRNLSICEGVILAYTKKANTLQSRGANLRTEFEKTGIATHRTRPESGEESPERRRRTNKVRGIFSAKNGENEDPEASEDADE